MKEFLIRQNEAGQRFDKYLGKLLKKAPKSFFYKMLRKKNITLNGHKAEGSEILSEGDTVRLFLSDDTFLSFSEGETAEYFFKELDVIYEDKDMILINKPAGMLTQPDATEKPALSDYLIGFLMKNGQITEEELRTFHPAPVNRLDRNTSGIVLCGKTLAGLQLLSKLLHDRSLHKYYLCLVEGTVKSEKYVKGYLHKDKTCNKVVVSREAGPQDVPIETEYRPVSCGNNRTLLLVQLITGKPHQIRAHLASEGFPVVGDRKYTADTGSYKEKKGTEARHQMLHAWYVTFPELEGAWEYLSGRTFYAGISGAFKNILEKSGIKETEKYGSV